MRVTNQMSTVRTQRNLSSLQQRIATHQANIATGRRVRTMSDDPAAGAQAMKLSRELRHVDQYDRNVGDATVWLNLADEATQTIDDRLTRARNLMLQSDSGVLGQAARSAIATELRGIAEEITDALNTTRAGHPIFGGTSPSNKAFDSSGAFLGNSDTVLRSASPTVKLEVNVNGELVAGTFDAGDPANGNIMQVLNHVANEIDAGNAAAPHLTRMSQLQQGVHSAQATIGARQAAAESHVARIADLKVTLGARMSDTVDADLATELMEVQSSEVAYQATVGVAARVLNTSILDFLR